MTAFETTIIAQAGDIDEMGHVNNAVWVRWIQDIAGAHWHATAAPDQISAFLWVIVRHEIDYLRPLREGGSVTARTWVGEAPRGAKFDRHVEFTGAGGKVHVRAKTTWAMIDRATGKALRVPADVTARFVE